MTSIKPWTGCSSGRAVSKKRFAKRHLTKGDMVLHDPVSTYFEGSTCPLTARGYSRDGKKGTLRVNLGPTTDSRVPFPLKSSKAIPPTPRPSWAP